jgi:hypothetical protein
MYSTVPIGTYTVRVINCDDLSLLESTTTVELARILALLMLTCVLSIPLGIPHYRVYTSGLDTYPVLVPYQARRDTVCDMYCTIHSLQAF